MYVAALLSKLLNYNAITFLKITKLVCMQKFLKVNCDML